MASDIVKGTKGVINGVQALGRGAKRGFLNTVKYLANSNIRKIADDILQAGEKIVIKGKKTWGSVKDTICKVKNVFGYIGCFAEGTLVKTENGYKKIEEIKKGEKVYSYDYITGKEELKEVLETKRVYEQGKTLKLKLSGGKEIETTLTHEFMSEGENWVKAEELTVGSRLYNKGNSLIEVIEIKEVENNVPKLMYDLEVEDNHNYYITESDILVHNDDCPRKILEQLEKAADEVKSGVREVGEVVELKSYPNKLKLDELASKDLKLEINGVEFKKVEEIFEVNGINLKTSYYAPDFSTSTKYSIPFEELGNKYSKHFKEGNEIFENKLLNNTDKDLKKIFGKEFRKEGSNIIDLNGNAYVWHHNLETKSLDLVPKEVHDSARHMGAGSAMGVLQDYFKR